MENKEKLIDTIFDLVLIVDRENRNGKGQEILNREIIYNIDDKVEQKIARIIFEFDGYNVNVDNKEINEIYFDYGELQRFFMKRMPNKALQNIKSELVDNVEDPKDCETKESISDYALEADKLE